MTAASFARRVLDRTSGEWGSGGPQNAWLNADGSVTPVEHHEDDGGYTQATLKNKVRIIVMRGELTVDGSLMNNSMTPQQIESIRVIYAQTKVRNLYIGGPRQVWEETVLRGASAREVGEAVEKLSKALGS